MASTQTSAALSGAASGAAIGTAFAPGVGTAVGAGVGGLLGLIIGGQAEDEAERAQAEQKRIQNESQKFQANARAQRLSLLQTGRRFAEEGSSPSSALGSLGQSSEPITQSKGSLSSGTF